MTDITDITDTTHRQTPMILQTQHTYIKYVYDMISRVDQPILVFIN